MKAAVKKSKAHRADYIALKQLERDLQDREMRLHTMQYTLDMVMVALGRLGYGAKRLNEIAKMIDEVSREYAEDVVKDAETDNELVYSRTSLDRELKQYVGENFIPYQERYKWREK